MSVFEPFDSFSDIDDILLKLEDEDPGIRQVGVMELAETASEDAVPHIIGALSDPSVDVRLQAARVLQEFDGETVAAGLADALQDASDTVAPSSFAIATEPLKCLRSLISSGIVSKA